MMVLRQNVPNKAGIALLLPLLLLGHLVDLGGDEPLGEFVVVLRYEFRRNDQNAGGPAPCHHVHELGELIVGDVGVGVVLREIPFLAVVVQLPQPFLDGFHLVLDIFHLVLQLGALAVQLRLGLEALFRFHLPGGWQPHRYRYRAGVLVRFAYGPFSISTSRQFFQLLHFLLGRPHQLLAPLPQRLGGQTPQIIIEPKRVAASNRHPYRIPLPVAVLVRPAEQIPVLRLCVRLIPTVHVREFQLEPRVVKQPHHGPHRALQRFDIVEFLLPALDDLEDSVVFVFRDAAFANFRVPKGRGVISDEMLRFAHVFGDFGVFVPSERCAGLHERRVVVFPPIGKPFGEQSFLHELLLRV
mmetsp:Transcript_44363/g.51982  ORF Transcript_44363/g.51982 Transcript_44363/m.51982 type:complete len:355 (+) Transcript_44363:679-1743(+)